MKSIPKVSRVHAAVTAPPSKSYSVRAILLGAMSAGETLITNALDADDTRYALEAVRSLGFRVEGSFKTGVRIGERVSMSAGDVNLFVGNAGTAMRFLTGWLPFTPGRFILDGEKRMRERPIGELVDVLLGIGAEVEYVEREGFPPLRIRGKRMRGGFSITIAATTSSQFASALMLGGATLPSGMTLHISALASAPYVDVTADILRDFGARVDRSGNTIRVSAAQLARDEYRVEGDYSSAAYWFAAGAATGGEVRVAGLRADSAQGDRQFLQILEKMGCNVAPASANLAPASAGEAIIVTGPSQLQGGEFDCNSTPDIVPTLAAIAPLAASAVTITNIANLRVKESDRIATIATELRRLGARVEEREDGLTIEPGWSGEPVTVQTHNDHRIAMSFAIAGLARGNVTIADEIVVSKSYPRFWRTLDELVGTS